MNDYIIDDINYTREDISELIGSKATSQNNLFGAYSSAILIGACTAVMVPIDSGIGKDDAKPIIEYLVAEKQNFSIEEYENIFINDYSKYIINPELSDKKKKETIQAILSFKSLQESWDGYGALPLEVKSASNSIEFLENLNLNSKFVAPDDVFPNPTGTVSLIWENDVNERISLEIGNTAFSYYTKFNNSLPEFFTDVKFNNTNIGDIYRKIKAIY